MVLCYQESVIFIYTTYYLCVCFPVMAEAIILPSFEFTMGIRGFHVYMKDWKPYAKERLELLPERNNKHDPCAVAVIKRSHLPLTRFTEASFKVVGHIPVELSRYVFFAIQHGCDFRLRVISPRPQRSPITKGGLEIKAAVTVEWKQKEMFDVLKEYVTRNCVYENSLRDDSATILEEIKMKIDSDMADDATNDESLEKEQEMPMDVENDIPIIIDE